MGEKKKKGYKGITATVIIVVIIALLVFYVMMVNISKKERYETFAQCLVTKDAKMYGNYNCPHCNAQKEAFKGAFHILEENGAYVECSTSPDICDKAGIKGVPTWMINGVPVQGITPLDRLAVMIDCKL